MSSCAGGVVLEPLGSSCATERKMSKVPSLNGEHVKVEFRHGVAVVKLDSPDSKVNVLSQDVIEEFTEVLNDIVQNDAASAVVVISGKPGCFIAGADIKMIERCKTVQEATGKSRDGQRVLDDIEASRKPVVAAIYGSCLGGGLEVAMACHYRIAVDDKKTGLGLPEVKLGILPGCGGTQRLPKLAGVTNSLDMILTGKTLTASKAKEFGIVDVVLKPLEFSETESSEARTMNHLEEIAIQTAQDLACGKLQISRSKSFMDKLMDMALSFGFVKNKIFERAKSQVLERTKGLYPAPLKILEVVRTGIDEGSEAGYRAEAEGFGELAMTSESKGLISLFHGQTECKKNAFGEPRRPTKSLAVIGAGERGAGIAQISVEKGYQCTLIDIDQEALIREKEQISKNFETSITRKRYSSTEVQKFMENLRTQLDYTGLDQVDLVIEALPEDIDKKQRILQELEEHVPHHCVIASTTRTIPVTSLASVSKRPENVIGMHYFCPVDKTQLLEISVTDKTSEDTIATAVNVGLKQGKIVIVVKDAPGLFVSRILGAFGSEVIKLLLEGIDIHDMDKMSTEFGFAVGACTLLDEMGLDIVLNMVQVFGDRFADPSVAEFLSELIEDGNFGKKSGKGLFIHSSNGSRGSNKELNPKAVELLAKHKIDVEITPDMDECRIRLLARFCNEAALCLEQEVLRSPLEGDVGSVFGLGFPPFTGGPLHFMDTYGGKNFVAKLKKLEQDRGSMFRPCRLLEEYAETGRKWFPDS